MWMVERCKAKAPLVAEVAQWVSWTKVWDASMDFGIGCSRGMQALVRVMCHHGQRFRLCPLCDCPSLYEVSLLHHLLVHRAHALGLGDLHSVEDVTAVVELKLIKFSKLKNLFNACLSLAKHFCMVPFFCLVFVRLCSWWACQV